MSGTTTSFRGYEGMPPLPGTHCTDDAAEFRRPVRRALDGSLSAPAVERRDVRRRVLWTETLKALPAEIRAL